MQPTQNTAVKVDVQPSRCWDGAPETDFDRRFFDLRESGYTGWINQNGYPVTKDGHPVVWPQEFDGCSVCGAAFSFGSSQSSVCGICAMAPSDGEFSDPPVRVVTTVTPASTLRATARYLSRHGWIQGCYYDSTATVFTPSACMVGALGSVCYGGPVEAPAQHFDDPGFDEFEAALTWLDSYLVDQYGVIAYEFNDAKGRTAGQAIAALLAAADGWDHTDGGAA